jgi:hypothetical protein
MVFYKFGVVLWLVTFCDFLLWWRFVTGDILWLVTLVTFWDLWHFVTGGVLKGYQNIGGGGRIYISMIVCMI